MLRVPHRFENVLWALAEDTAAVFNYDQPCIFEVLDVALDCAGCQAQRDDFASEQVASFATADFHADELPLGATMRLMVEAAAERNGWVFLRRDLDAGRSLDTPTQLRHVAQSSAGANCNGQVDPAGYPITLTAHQMGIVQKLAERWQVTTEQALGAALEVGIQRARHLLTEEQDHPD